MCGQKINKRRILVSAYGCEPFKGSESGVGWNWVLQMGKTNCLHVITRANNRDSIEQNFPEELSQNIIFHYYDAPAFILKRKRRAKNLYSYYFCWQLGIIPLIKKLKKEIHFDYSMHLTFGSMWMPTFLPFFNIPFIWGPIGGGDSEPRSFMRILPIKSRLIQSLRYVLNCTGTLNPLILIPSSKAVSILIRTYNSTKVIPSMYQSKVRIVLETSIEEDVFKYLRIGNSEERFNLIVTGRLMASKNIRTIVRALNYIPSTYDILLTIIGAGTERVKLDYDIKRYSLNNRVQIISEIPRNDIFHYLEKSDIFVFPSLREGGSWSLMEAMAIGLPIICLNCSGMQVITDDTCAIRLPVTDPEQMPKDLAEAICKLIDNPELRRSMGQAARERIRTVFNWDAKGKFMENLLTELDTQKAKKNV